MSSLPLFSLPLIPVNWDNHGILTLKKANLLCTVRLPLLWLNSSIIFSSTCPWNHSSGLIWLMRDLNTEDHKLCIPKSLNFHLSPTEAGINVNWKWFLDSCTSHWPAQLLCGSVQASASCCGDRREVCCCTHPSHRGCIQLCLEVFIFCKTTRQPVFLSVQEL